MTFEAGILAVPVTKFMTNEKFCADELATRVLLDTYRDKEWSQDRAILAIVWKACWSSAMDVDQINRIANAMCNMESYNAQSTLTAACRAKVLRSYTKHGRKLYEVNF